VKHLGTLGYRSLAVDLYGGKSATNREEAVKLMQSLDRKATDKILSNPRIRSTADDVSETIRAAISARLRSENSSALSLS